jgi:hypothetical protein
MKKILLLTIFLIALANCSLTKDIKIGNTDLKAIKGKSISIHTSPKPVFIDKTPAKMLISGFLMMSNKIVKDNNVKDPALILGKEMSDILTENYKVNIKTHTPKEEIDGYNVKKISNSYKGFSDYVLSSRTLSYGISYIRFDIKGIGVKS